MQLNTQPPEKSVPAETSGRVRVHSIFHTIQGEGPFAGTPALFIRLAGCNLQCPLCDTDYTTGRKTMSVSDVVTEVLMALGGHTRLIVITGGEPFRQDISKLVAALLFTGFEVQIETNGTLAPPSAMQPHSQLHVVCSPKTGRVNPQLRPFISAYKYVLHKDDADPVDGLPRRVLDHPALRVARPHTGFTGPVYLQPVDTQDAAENAAHAAEVAKQCMLHGYRLCLQMHKYVNIP